ncbi:hypothetical protein AMATHDRAFT_4143 [Amanita thiersii Skay4041]|uniref:BTB domain-containing protein n=1 Tax=Amanita thiersii Skay4041 TaxID=703135 RepID=A0A2A9NLM7_9AGAR|nr:hypothetical protein AMATHDRAFT_4143 [Amanita thiersii Skay4041]
MDAKSPFDSTVYADVIICSSDSVNFYVIRSLLCCVSLPLRDMFQLNRGPAIEHNVMKDGLPVIDFAENSETLYLLLTLLYPRGEEPGLDDCSLFWRVGKAAQKYCMDVIEAKLQRLIRSSTLMQSEPLRMYAILVNLGWNEIASLAAQNTLATPLEKLVGVNELREISGADYYTFLEYRLRCSKSAKPENERLIRPSGILPLLYSVDTAPPQVEGLEKSGLPMHSKEPFDSSARADAILRSSDSVDFFVLESILRISSPVFEDTFSANRARNSGIETNDKLPVVPVEERSETLRQLLLLIYPYDDESIIHDVVLFSNVAVAARKYKMSAVEKKLQRQLVGSPLLSKEPLQVYTRAVSLGFKEAAELAAKSMLSQELQDMTYVKGLDHITGMDLHHLLEYRFKCGDAALMVWEMVDKRELFDSEYGRSSYNRTSMNYWTSRRYDTLDKSTAEKLKARPRGSTITEFDDQLVQKIAEIPEMSDRYHDGILRAEAVCKFLKSLQRIAAEVEDEVSKVPLVVDGDTDVELPQAASGTR